VGGRVGDSDETHAELNDDIDVFNVAGKAAYPNAGLITTGKQQEIV
jgi:hypothetical protein